MDANVTRDRGGFLVFAQGPSLWKLPGEDVGETRELTNISGETNRVVAVDCVNQHLYWTILGKGIRRSRYDGSDNHLVVTKAHFFTELAVDFVAGNMFWVRGNALRVAKISHLEAGHKTIISHTGIILYSALAVHPSRGSIYWSHSKTTIEAASMDGSNRQVWVTGVCAVSLALDYEANDLYWTDRNTGNIECISLNGGGKRIVSAQGSKGQDSLGISLSGGRVYWTSVSSTGTVKSITKSGSTMKQHSLPAGRSGYLSELFLCQNSAQNLELAVHPGRGADTLALDYEANDLYWIDDNTGNIECISLNGGGKRIVSAQGNAGRNSLGISLSGERIYWTFWTDDIVNSITKSGSAMKQHSLPAGRSGYLYGIVFVPEECPK
ncbi:putative Low-density lipoprotein receptor-related protein 1B, partial [Hypsibius exemplaris]